MNEHLYRSNDDRVLAGVAGGLAEIWDVDPSLVRIAWVLLAILTGGIFFVVYVVMAIVVPEAPIGYGMPATGAGATAPGIPTSAPIPGWVPPGPVAAAPEGGAAGPGSVWPGTWSDRHEARRAARAARRAARSGRGSGSAGLLIGGVLVFIGVMFFARELVPAFDVDLFWPLGLIALGVILVVASVRREPVAGPGQSS